MVSQAEFVAVKPNSLFDHLFGETSDANAKLKIKAINPITSKELPIYLSNDLKYPLGRDTHLGVPLAFENDRKFAEKVGLKLSTPDVEVDLSTAEKQDLKFDRVGSQHGDWLVTQNNVISVPVPLVHCPACGFHPVPEQELPITLPPLPEELRKQDFDMLLETNDWTKIVCPK